MRGISSFFTSAFHQLLRKLSNVGRARLVARVGRIKTFVRKSEWKRTRRIIMRRSENDIKSDPKAVRW
jgi:hypothetical protein